MHLPRAAGPIQATAVPPASKSITHRALAAAALRPGVTVIQNPLQADDTRLTAAGLAALGARVEQAPGEWMVRGWSAGRPEPEPGASLDLGNSGTSLRLLLALASLGATEVVLDGDPRLRQRPVGPLAAVLETLGARVRWLGETGFPPLAVAGPLRPAVAEVTVAAADSSQYVSGLLLAAAGLRQPLVVRATGMSSRPYADLTAAVMGEFGLRAEPVAGPASGTGSVERSLRRGLVGEQADGEVAWRVSPASGSSPGSYRVESDASSAAFLLAAGVVTGGRVEIRGVGAATRQGDIALLDLLAGMGCALEGRKEFVAASEKPACGIDANLNATPDLVPPLSAVAMYAPGPTRLTGLGHLRLKESDRLGALASELSKLGGRVTAGEDWLEIVPPDGPPRGGVSVSAHGDHRIAMALAVAALGADGPVDLDEPACVAKSYPDFFADLQALIQGIDVSR